MDCEIRCCVPFEPGYVVMVVVVAVVVVGTRQKPQNRIKTVSKVFEFYSTAGDGKDVWRKISVPPKPSSLRFFTVIVFAIEKSYVARHSPEGFDGRRRAL